MSADKITGNLPPVEPGMKVKLVPGYPMYAATDQGVIWSKSYGYWKILKKPLDNKGYPVVGLYKDGRATQFRVHIVILLTFRGPRPKGMQGRHLNGIPRDVKLSNLAWGTHRENTDDRIKHGHQPMGSNHAMSVLTESEVEVIKKRLCGSELHREIAEDYGVDKSLMSHINCGRIWRHVGPKMKSRPKQILTDDQATEIRKRSKNGERTRDLAKEFGVSEPTVSSIKHGVRRKVNP